MPTDPIARCDRELAHLEQRLRAGEEPVDGILLGIQDWSAEKRLLEKEGSAPEQQALISIPAKERDTWLTPSWILDKLGRFDLDPCAADEFPSRIAPQYFTAELNGLTRPWFGRVFMNPPFSNLTPWLERMSQHGDGIALLPGNHETFAWTKFVWAKADALLLLPGRVSFMLPDGKNSTGRPRQSTALIAYGHSNAAILSRSGLQGVLIWAWQQLGKASA